MNMKEISEGMNRRRFVALGVGALAASVAPLTLRRHRRMVRRSVPIMGTMADLVTYHSDPRVAHAALDAAVAELRFVEATMTKFDPESQIGRANRFAAREGVTVGPATFVVLAQSLRWAEGTDGEFDPCIGAAVDLWSVESSGVPPDQRDISGHAGLYRRLDLDRRGRRVRFEDDRIQLDLGGIAKGYAVDRAAAVLRDLGMENALVNVGGDLVAVGSSPDGEGWDVGVRDPFQPDRVTHTLHVSDRAVATSGDYLRYFEHGGRRYHHLIDPVTGAPRQTEMRSLTVVSDSCMSADAAATALFGSSVEGFEQRVRRVDPSVETAWVI